MSEFIILETCGGGTECFYSYGEFAELDTATKNPTYAGNLEQSVGLLFGMGYNTIQEITSFNGQVNYKFVKGLKTIKQLLNDYQEWTAGKVPPRLVLDHASNMALGMCGDGGEFADVFKKIIFHGHPFDKVVDHLKEEGGDFLFYLAATCEVHGIALGDVWETEKVVSINGEFKNSELNRRDNVTIDVLATIEESSGWIFKDVRWGGRSQETATFQIREVVRGVKTLFEMWGLDVKEVVKINQDKLNTRYPDGFTTEASLKRVDIDKITACENCGAIGWHGGEVICKKCKDADTDKSKNTKGSKVKIGTFWWGDESP